MALLVLSPDSFGSLMDIDKLILHHGWLPSSHSFGSLMDIDKLILGQEPLVGVRVLVL